jgi:hypothetical protein
LISHQKKIQNATKSKIKTWPVILNDNSRLGEMENHIKSNTIST